MMDVATVSHFFDRFHDNHRAHGDYLETSFERGEVDGVGFTTITLRCPICDNTVTGSIRDTDMPQLVQLIGKRPS